MEATQEINALADMEDKQLHSKETMSEDKINQA